MFHKYPYTDFNEYNLDWVIERVKQLTADWLETAEQWTNTEEEWNTLYNYVHDYFDNLDVTQEVGQIINDYRLDGTLSTICQPIVDHWVETNVPNQINEWLDTNITQETGYVLDRSLTLSNAAAPADLVGDLKQDLNNALDVYRHDLDELAYGYNNISEYFYKANTYINSSGVETTLNGYDLYKIPLNDSGFIHVSWDTTDPFWYQLAHGYQFSVEADDDTISNCTVGNNQDYYVPAYYNGDNNSAEFYKNSSVKNLFISVYRGKEDKVILNINTPFPILNNVQKSVYDITKENTVNSLNYFLQGGKGRTFLSTPTYHVFFKKVNNGDSLEMSGSLTGLSFNGLFIDSTLTITEIFINDNKFTATSDGWVELFANDNQDRKYTYLPKDAIKVEAKNVIGLTVGQQFDGLNGVAFGTSLTYRSISSYGFLTKLSELSGINFDNQGIGSSEIISDMLTSIKGYTGYSGKRIALLEGFVNDWYQGNTLGTYTDTTETTVCGCVRSAINYMLSQNANLTVFLILDHYGKLANDVDCRTTAENANGLTQYEYYEEIAKVAESLGIPVIKEYEISQISENTPQYLADNIHLNALGANQSGYAIWSEMSNRYPNLI